MTAAATSEDRTLVQRFLEDLHNREIAPTADEIAKRYPDLDPIILDAFLNLMRTVGWKITTALVGLLLTVIVTAHYSQGTDSRVSRLEHAVQDENQSHTAWQEKLTQQIENLQAQWRDQMAASSVSQPPREVGSTARSGRANPKGTPPRPKKRNRKG